MSYLMGMFSFVSNLWHEPVYRKVMAWNLIVKPSRV